MEKLKEIIVITPFLALSIAVTYLQGYWGFFDISPFPYISFQELLAYSASPFFGILFFMLAGMFIGLLDKPKKPTTIRDRFIDWQYWVQLLMTGILSVAAFYKKFPTRWLIISMLSILVITPWLAQREVIQRFKANYFLLSLITYIIIYMMIISFAYGRYRAEELLQRKEPNVRLTWDTNITEETKMIGLLGGFYFYFDSIDQINVVGERYIKTIQYIRTKKENIGTRSSIQPSVSNKIDPKAL